MKMINKNVTFRMKDYFTASIQLDVRMLEGIYASEFESVRTDLKGQLILISREQLLHKVLQLKKQKLSLPGLNKIEFLGISEYGDICSLIYRMVKGEEQAIHHYVWQQTDNQHFMVRQFTVEQDLTYLL